MSCFFAEPAGGDYVRTDRRTFNRAEHQSAGDFDVHEYLGAGAERCQPGAAWVRRVGLPLPKSRRRRDRPAQLGKARLLRWDPNQKAIHWEKYFLCTLSSLLLFRCHASRVKFARPHGKFNFSPLSACVRFSRGLFEKYGFWRYARAADDAQRMKYFTRLSPTKELNSSFT